MTELAISAILSDGKYREIRLGRHHAYGEVAVDGMTYALVHAPTQDDFDVIAAALDAATPTQVREAIAGPSMVNEEGAESTIIATMDPENENRHDDAYLLAGAKELLDGYKTILRHLASEPLNDDELALLCREMIAIAEGEPQDYDESLSAL